MSVIKFPGMPSDIPDDRVELYRAEHPDVLHVPSDTWRSLRVSAAFSSFHDGAVELGEYQLDPDQARALIASLQAAVSYATPDVLPDGSRRYGAAPDTTEVGQ